MGGRIWSMKEESVFWYLVRHSPKRLGKDLINNPEQPWAQLSDTMHAKMGADARRQYTGLSLYEHYFLNANKGKFSPNAGRLPLKYRRHELAMQKKKEEVRAQRERDNEADAAGDVNSPIVINCQYPTVPSYHEHAPAPGSTPPSVHTSFASPVFLPPPSHHYPHQFLANHDRSVNTGAEDDSLFVTLPPASWMDAASLHSGYDHHHR